MVMRGEQARPGPGRPHSSPFASSATLYDIGFQLFLPGSHRRTRRRPGVLPGPRVPGVYARPSSKAASARNNWRTSARKWTATACPPIRTLADARLLAVLTVSMGLGLIQAIYQARFMKYLESRGFIPAGKQKVWCSHGRRRVRRAESLGAISLAGREKLDNLIFVINCNLQRFDGPVRGNAKIIQELEGVFRGAEWNVNKVIWGRFGTRCSPRTPPACCSSAWTRSSTANTRTTRRKTAPTCASTSSARVRNWKWSGTFPTRKSGSSTAAATTLTRSMRPTTRRSTTGPADRHPG